MRQLGCQLLLHVSQIAKRQAVVNPENTFFSVKRFIGRKMDEIKDESKQVGGDWACCIWFAAHE